MWLTVGDAARRANVDPRTIRRWADTQRVRSRVTPGGHRQISLSGLVEQFDQATNLKHSRHAPTNPFDTQTPDQVVPVLADSALTWSHWQPPRTLTDDALAQLRMDLRSLVDTLSEVDAVITDELAARDARATPDNPWD